MSYDKIAQAWTDIWNGDLSLVEGTVHPDFVSHAAPLLGGPPADTAGRDKLDIWVGGIRAAVPDLRFTVQVGPLVDEPYLVLRWLGRGTYQSGLPGAAPGPTPIEFFGTDILKVTDNLISEYWANADSMWVVQQLGIS
ncbi:ester cyclase [Nocardia sp. NPDC050710]|uniref:ester cyclase n=1 Tax=Nocardia sp. NPDC050710 TaxID=3157220 RepID=UPI0033E5A8FC